MAELCPPLFARRLSFLLIDAKVLHSVTNCLSDAHELAVHALELCMVLPPLFYFLFDEHDLMVDDFLSIDQVHKVILVVILNLIFLGIAHAPLLLNHIHADLPVDNTLGAWLHLDRGSVFLYCSADIIDIFLVLIFVEAEMNQLEDGLKKL